MRRALLVAVTVVSVGTLAGCAAAGSAGAPAPLPIGEQPYTWTGAPSPLTEFLLSGPDADPAALAAEDLAREQAVQACMAGRGLTYVPVVVDPASYVGVDAQLPELTRQEFAETYGFGVSSSPDGILSGDAYTSYAPATDDVNATAYEAMDEQGRAAWDVALYGSGYADLGAYPEEVPAVAGDGGSSGYVESGPVEPAVAPSDAPLTDEQRGCLDLSYDGWSDSAATAAAETYGALEQQLAELEQTITDDPRATAATTDYTVCMRAAGYEVTGLLDVQAQASDRFYALTGGGTASTGASTGDGASVGSEPVEALSDEELDALADQPLDPPASGPVEPDPAELAAVQAQEVQAAVADLRCLAPSEPTLTAVRAELENAFLDAHRPEMEAMRASLGG